MSRHGVSQGLGWGGIALLVVLALGVAACGDDAAEPAGDVGADDGSDESAQDLDGSWSGSTTDGGTIDFTVSDGTITAYTLESSEGVFGPDCGVVSGINQVADTDVPIEDGEFSWGGSGEGYPVTGTFDSETTASGTAEFDPGVESGACQAVDVTWEAERSD